MLTSQENEAPTIPPTTSRPVPLMEIGFENGAFDASTTPWRRKKSSQVIQPTCSIQSAPTRPVKNEPERPISTEPSSLMSKISIDGLPTFASISAPLMYSHWSPPNQSTYGTSLHHCSAPIGVSPRA